jgi:hypothetical protein
MELITLGTTEEWNLTISATNQLEPVTFGIHPNATDDYDPEFDAFAQTPVQGKVILILDNIYAKEINREKMTWNLSIGVPTGETPTLSWNSSQIPADINLLLDGTDMKSQSSLPLNEGAHSFVINGSVVEVEEIFDTGHSANPYASIPGIHNGTITPLYDIVNITILYTYPCSGTGGHAEYAKISNKSWSIETLPLNGYVEDWHNLTFNESFTLYANHTYNFTIKTGSYPQIIHESPFNATGGVITCTSFEDINGKRHENWIPAIRLE